MNILIYGPCRGHILFVVVFCSWVSDIRVSYTNPRGILSHHLPDVLINSTQNGEYFALLYLSILRVYQFGVINIHDFGCKV